MRLDKFLAESGLGSRNDVKKYIRKGKISVNGKAALKPDMHIDENKDIISAFGQEIKFEKFVYIMLNKPAGCISASYDKNQKTVMDFIDEKDRRRGMFPVGRLDKDTAGLIIITNDGRFSHESLSPKKHVEKVYFAATDKPLESSDIKSFRDGIKIGNYLCKSAELEIISEKEAYVTLTEGKFHQVKKMFEALGKKVVYLKRIRFGNIKLDVEEGKYRFLSNNEIFLEKQE